MLVECEECTTTYPPDVANCPHCGTPNHVLLSSAFMQQDEIDALIEQANAAKNESTDEPPAEELPPNVRRSRKTETVQLPDQKENG